MGEVTLTLTMPPVSIADMAVLALRHAGVTAEFVEHQIDQWASIGATAERHLVRLSIDDADEAGLRELVEGVAQALVGMTIAGQVILEADAELLFGEALVVDLHALSTS